MGRLADLINGTDSDDSTAAAATETPQTPAAQEPSPAPQHNTESPRQPLVQPKEEVKSESELFDNAIDKRNRAIQYLKEEFKSATGSTSASLASLYVYVIVDTEDYDVKRYAWADDTMKEQLRLELDNAMLESVGKRTLEIRPITKENLPERAKEVIADTLYYSFLAAPKRQSRVRGKITVVEGTGSLAKNEYILDSDKKQVYHIGRGPMANKPGAYRPNDIVVRDNDPETELQQRNNHVSSAHADIIASNGRFFLKALKWGCRPMGGACTKLIYDDTDHEIRDTSMRHPLHDGYVIELGKQVVLLYESLSEED